MSRKRKANINPSLVGEYFSDGKDIYRLERCGTEPLACMLKIGGDGISQEKPISEFANFVQLKPVRPIEKPVAPRKVRSDKDKPHKKPANKKAEADTEIADKKGDNSPDISTFSLKTSLNKPYVVSIGEISVTSDLMRRGVEELLEKCGIDREFVKNAPDSEGKRALLAILDGWRIKDVRSGKA